MERRFPVNLAKCCKMQQKCSKNLDTKYRNVLQICLAAFLLYIRNQKQNKNCKVNIAASVWVIDQCICSLEKSEWKTWNTYLPFNQRESKVQNVVLEMLTVLSLQELSMCQPRCSHICSVLFYLCLTVISTMTVTRRLLRSKWKFGNRCHRGNHGWYETFARCPLVLEVKVWLWLCSDGSNACCSWMWKANVDAVFSDASEFVHRSLEIPFLQSSSLFWLFERSYHQPSPEEERAVLISLLQVSVWICFVALLDF